MGLFSILDESKHREIDNHHIISNNYKVFLYQEHYRQDSTIIYHVGGSPLLTLTNNSLEKFSIKANDEVKKKKPCTRKEVMVTVIHKGFDFNLTFAKTTDDIDSMMFMQYMKYHGQMQNMGIQKRSDETKAGDAVSVFNSKDQERNLILPTYALGIEISLYNNSKENTTKKIYYKFHNVTFFSFEQNVEGGATDIMESIQAFAPYQNYESVDTENKFNDHIDIMINGLTTSPIGKRYILNKGIVQNPARNIVGGIGEKD